MAMNPKPVVLIVEDNPAGISSLVGILGGTCELIVAKTLADARRFLSAEVDVVLLDLYLPDGRGVDLLEYRHDKPSCAEIPVICISASDQTSDIEEAFHHGAIDYVVKPFNPVILQAKVSTFVAFKRQTDELAAQALVDPLTGIGNRRLFEQKLGGEWRRANRHRYGLAVVLADLDNFKLINDGHGHATGDDCLRLLANVMSDVFSRAGDVVARLGGDEFAALLPDADLGAAVAMANQLQEALSARVKLSDNPAFTISVGCHAGVPSDDWSLSELMAQADRYLYQAKVSGGRNCVRPSLESDECAAVVPAPVAAAKGVEEP